MKILICLIVTICFSRSHTQIPILSSVVGELLDTSLDLLDGGLADSFRTPCQLIESRNFICDEHFVVTPDGYILSIQHVINPVLIAKLKKTIKPLILQHGFFGSATHWMINSDGTFADDWTGEVINVDLNIVGRNAGFLLANLGYDVWIPNFRGNIYSRNHTYLNPDTDDEFWRFSYEQMITFDTPTIIDYVLNRTGHQNLAWVGHSLGTAVLFGLLSERQEYVDKIKPFIALAPVTHTGHITTPLRGIAYLPTLKQLLALGGGELNLPRSVVDLAADRICALPLIEGGCESIFYLFGGYDPEQFNSTRLPVYIEEGFCGSSIWTLVHFGFNIMKDQFAKFDYGHLGNIAKYNETDPPQYNLSAINLDNIVLITSEYDPLADPEDVATLKKSLTVPYIEYSVAYPKFGHLDFLWAKNVYSQVYKPMVSFLRKLG